LKQSLMLRSRCQKCQGQAPSANFASTPFPMASRGAFSFGASTPEVCCIFRPRPICAPQDAPAISPRVFYLFTQNSMTAAAHSNAILLTVYARNKS